MVIGGGLVAKGFKTYRNNNGCLIFASGVSNSETTYASEFEREKKLLQCAIKENQDKIFVYFGTCSVYDESSKSLPYIKHKLAMERMIKEYHNNYHIFRISNLAGKTNNAHTVLNYFFLHIIHNEFFNLWKNAFRNIIDLDDAVFLCDYIIQQGLFKNEIVNIANPENYPVVKIVQLLERINKKKANYNLIDKGGNPAIDTKPIQYLFPILDINFGENYLYTTLKKYYS